MAILNVTPDSFSDGSKYSKPAGAVERAWEIVRQGADILDIGGMSSRPGAEEISEAEEMDRIMPVLQALGEDYPLPVSVDTYRAKVAREAIRSGASIVNDITALAGDPQMAPLIAECGCGLVLMHMRGTPQTMQKNTHYDNLIEDISEFLHQRVLTAGSAGISPEHMVTDPGIGFGKPVEGNLDLIRHMNRFKSGTAGVLSGPSRKSFIGKIIDREVDKRLWGSVAAAVCSVATGADIVRIHDVEATLDACRMTDAIFRREAFHAAS